MSARPPSPEPFLEGENEVQRDIRLKVCAYCKAPGARKKCNGCRQRTYCNKECQKKDWKTAHREQCEKRGAAAAEVDGGGSVSAVLEEDEIEYPCPICLDNEDNAYVSGQQSGMCFACGQSYCGACNTPEAIGQLATCPTCRAPRIPLRGQFTQCWKLVHDRLPGRHTPGAQNALGGMYRAGRGVKQDRKEAVTWYKLAAEQGHADAQYNLALQYSEGVGVKQDLAKAAKLYQLAADQGQSEAQASLGSFYERGTCVKKDYGHALKWYRLAAEQGNGLGFANLGKMYLGGRGVKQDAVAASKWFKLGVEQGNDDAQATLGWMYLESKDYDAAFKVSEMSAKQGNATAQNNLGCMYDKGLGVKQDTIKAGRWWRLAADQGQAAAQEFLGNMYQHGDGIAKDLSTAARLYTLAADQGYAVAQQSLAMMYRHGNGVGKDLGKALQLYALAAEQGNVDAQFNLGSMLCVYSNSGALRRMTKAPRKAVTWLQLAAKQGNTGGLEWLGNLQQSNAIPTLLEGTAVTTTLLTSAKAVKYNSRSGKVAVPTAGTATKPGRAAVILDGETAPISFKLMNLRVD